MNTPTRSYAVANQELVKAYERYLTARGNAEPTRKSYLDSVRRLVASVGAQSVVNLERFDIRAFFSKLMEQGLTANSIRLHTCALRNFFKFIRLSGLTRHDPMFMISSRKVGTRLPVVLRIEQLERLIAAARNPLEKAIVELLYATGVRVSELVKIRVDDIDWASRTIRIHKGKGGKDRVVIFGGHAADALHGYLCHTLREHLLLHSQWKGLLFPSLRIGNTKRYSVARKRSQLLRDLILNGRPGTPYSPHTIEVLVGRLGRLAGLGRVHPHALRRAFASHLLQNSGDLRVVQDLLGHERINTTVLYTHLDANHIKAVHRKFHPHENRKENTDDGSQDHTAAGRMPKVVR